NGELSELADLAIDGDRSAMLLRHYVVADRHAETGALASRLRREEWLKELVSGLGRNANAIIPHQHLDRITQIPRRHPQRCLECRVVSLLQALGSRIEAIAEQIETDPRDVLRDEFYRRDSLGIISFQRDVKARILGAATVIGEV